ncbi:hypothetical protein [Streptomyces torulosus]|nr:hypothetical protein [Streptomyces torulosus]
MHAADGDVPMISEVFGLSAQAATCHTATRPGSAPQPMTPPAIS